jgi:hypothetical protein
MANPETIIQNEGGVISNDLADLQNALHHDFDRQVVYKCVTTSSLLAS